MNLLSVLHNLEKMAKCRDLLVLFLAPFGFFCLSSLSSLFSSNE